MASFSKKTIIIGTSLGLAGILATSLAVAAIKHGKYHHEHHHGYHHEGGGHHMKLKKLDLDENDAVSLREFQAPAMKAFEMLDSNQDGTISSEEYLARTNERFTKFDADKSGAIEKSEMPRRRHYGNYRHHDEAS